VSLRGLVGCRRAVDVGFVCEVYHHLERPEAYMRALFDCLKPGGRLILIEVSRPHEAVSGRPTG
jgi:2-polyprenyl-3-methyl-5-hydroxy-6-metoxy-1,4-benzoquinol methylase